MPLLVLAFFLILSFIADGQIKYIGPVDSCGYMDKKYDSTITYYWQSRGKARYKVLFMNLHDSTSNHSFFRKPISYKFMAYRLSLYEKSAREIKQSNHCGNLCLVSFGFWIGSLTTSSLATIISKSNTFQISSYAALPVSLAGALVFGGLSKKLEVKAIEEYNLITEKKNLGL